MNISVLPKMQQQLSPNQIQVNENILLEWKFGEQRDVSITPETVDDCPVLAISTGAGEGWIRLRISPNETALGHVLGARMVAQVKKRASVKPYLLQVHDRTGRHEEAGPMKWGRLTMEAGKWADLVGSFVVKHIPVNHHFDMVVDLPSDTTVLIADCEIKYFGTAHAADEPVNKSAKSDLASVENFHVRPVEKLKSWLDNPAFYGGGFQVTHDVLEGWALTDATELYIATEENKTRKSVKLTKEHELSGSSSLPNSAFTLKTGETSRVEVYAQKTGGTPIWTGAVKASLKLAPPRKAEAARTRQDNYILIWAPIAIAGLTVQLEQVTEILRRNKFDFKISYHIAPRVDHPLCEHWIDPRDIDQPKMVFYMERFVEFDRGFEGAYKVFYMNLDWLSGKTQSVAKVHADVVTCPTPHLLEELTEEFSNSRVVHLPWPAKFKVQRDRPAKIEGKARVLYIGNDYDDVSRKHPFEVVEAILRLKRTDLVFDLKFRAPLPLEVRKKLEDNPRVDKIIDWSTDHAKVEELYRSADLNLIPNACEGNGLSILEAWSKGAVPAVLDGHPMKDVTRDDNSFRIPCEVVGYQERAPLHHATTEQIHEFLEKLDVATLQTKKEVVHGMEKELNNREKDLEKALTSFALMSGIRTKGIRMRVEEAHLPSARYKDVAKPRYGNRIKDLLLKDEGQKTFGRPARLVDVIMTTSQRPWCLRQSLDALMRAMRASPYQHRLFLLCDTVDPGTMAVIQQYSAEIDQVLWTKERHGLPYMWNSGRDLVRNTINRTERRPSYICYIQDDCLIVDPDTYFAKMVGLATEVMPGYLGLVSGFYTEVHPGWADFEWKKEPVIASDSIDGKNFMGTPELIESIGPLTWWFNDGMRRGNPGPIRGSHFDLWQWKESENSLSTQTRVSLLLPKLCKHVAEKAEDSTWNNDTTAEATAERIAINKVYNTRTFKPAKT